jgi:hypothetical protein
MALYDSYGFFGRAAAGQYILNILVALGKNQWGWRQTPVMKRGETKNNAVPLSEIAYRQIKSQVVQPGRSNLAPKSMKPITADALGIGRTPIRESLFRLAAEGLLRAKPAAVFLYGTLPWTISRTFSKH